MRPNSLQPDRSMRKIRPADRWVMGLAIAAGLALLVIGVRFLTVPHQAARFFGIGPAPGLASFDLHYVIGLRDLWLAGLLIGLALLREWRALAMCLGLGAAVCISDAMIVAGSSARGSAIAFHLASGLYCGALGLAAWFRYSAVDGAQADRLP